MRWRVVVIGLLALQQPLWDGCIAPESPHVELEIHEVRIREPPCLPKYPTLLKNATCHDVRLTFSSPDFEGAEDYWHRSHVGGFGWTAETRHGAMVEGSGREGPDYVEVGSEANLTVVFAVGADDVLRAVRYGLSDGGHAVDEVSPHHYEGPAGGGPSTR